MIDAFVRDMHTPDEEWLSPAQTKQILYEIHDAVISDSEKAIYPHKVSTYIMVEKV